MNIAQLHLIENRGGLDGSLTVDVDLPKGTPVYIRKTGQSYTLVAVPAIKLNTDPENLKAFLPMEIVGLEVEPITKPKKRKRA